MSPEVITRKLSSMNRYLQDLSPYSSIDFADFMADHYKIERLIELLVMAAADIALLLLLIRGEAPPGSYRAAFLRLGELHIIDPELSKDLSLGAGLRNILAHEYEAIDYRLLWQSVPQIIQDIDSFIRQVSARLKTIVWNGPASAEE